MSELIKHPCIQLVGIIESSRVLRKRGWQWWDSLLLLKRTGWRYATYLFMLTTAYSLLVRWVPSKRHTTISDYLKQQQTPRLTTRDINTPAAIDFITTCAADIMLSAHFNQFIHAEVLALPRIGCLNIHPGTLPTYQGVDPAFYMLLRRESMANVTIHYQDTAFDTGAIWASHTTHITDTDSLLSLNMRLFQNGIAVLLDTINAGKNWQECRQQALVGNYDSWPDSTTVTTLRKSGTRLFSLPTYLACFQH